MKQSVMQDSGDPGFRRASSGLRSSRQKAEAARKTPRRFTVAPS